VDKRFGKPGQSGDNDPGSSLSLSDLLLLPPAQRKVMRIVMRRTELSYPALCEVIDQLPEPERINRPDLDDILESLVQQNWLIQIGDRETRLYKLGKIQKTGPLDSVTAEQPAAEPERPSRRRSGLERLHNLWSKLENKPGQEKHTPPPSSRSAGERLADELSSKKPAGDTGEKYVSNMFRELARNPSAPPVDAQAHPEPKDIKPAGGGRISRMFEELSAKPPPDEEPDDDQS
jgi:hypothetical protein